MSSAVQKIVTPGGETLVVVPLAEYEALLDAADIAAANKIVAEVEAGRDELIPAAVVDRFVRGENAIRVWREYRGLTASELAAEAGISAPYLSELESGKKAGSVAALTRIAAALSLTIDDLV
jgi:DNA-binding XRE family transcriptional regulator